jgi:hypothetical protein
VKYLKKYQLFESESTEIIVGNARCPLIEVIDSEDPNIRTEGGKLVCGNVFYHGAMLNDIQQNELTQYFSKKGSRFEIKLKRLSDGKLHSALFTTPSFREAMSWAMSNIKSQLGFTGDDMGKPKNVFASVYKVTLKPGIKLAQTVITNFEYGERQNLESKGVAGSYGGAPTTKGFMAECGILSPDSVIKWELIKGGDILNHIKNDKTSVGLVASTFKNKSMTKNQLDSFFDIAGIERYLDPEAPIRTKPTPEYKEADELLINPEIRWSSY